MKDNTHHPTPSTPNTIPTGVYDLETIKAECQAIGIEPTRPNLRRIRRAIDLHQHGCVNPSSAKGIFTVKSQTDTDTVYVVIARQNRAKSIACLRRHSGWMSSLTRTPTVSHARQSFLRHIETLRDAASMQIRSFAIYR